MPNKHIMPDSSEGTSILMNLSEIEHLAVTIEGKAKSMQDELKQIRNEIQGMDMDESPKKAQDSQSDAGSLFF
jgi:hypothetical protein